MDVNFQQGLLMKMSRAYRVSSFAALLMFVALWGWRPAHGAAQAAANKPAKVHIFYSSDALGYHEPCG
jgi:hypothetical protein